GRRAECRTDAGWRAVQRAQERPGPHGRPIGRRRRRATGAPYAAGGAASRPWHPARRGQLHRRPADGSPYDPDSISKEWRLRIIRSGLPRIRFHDLRHTHASHMLASGVHPKIASERLGHSRVGITLDLYSHVTEGLQDDAVARVDAAMTTALEKRRGEMVAKR